MKNKILALIITIITSLPVLAETFVVTVTFPPEKVKAFAIASGWQEKITTVEKVEKEITEIATRLVPSESVDTNGDPILIPENYDVVRTVIEEQPVLKDNPVSAALWSKQKAGEAFIEYLSQYSVNALLAEKEIEKQLAIKSVKGLVGAGVSVSVQD